MSLLNDDFPPESWGQRIKIFIIIVVVVVVLWFVFEKLDLGLPGAFN